MARNHSPHAAEDPQDVSQPQHQMGDQPFESSHNDNHDRPGNNADDDTIDVELLIQTLDRKRKQIDRQIEQFRSLKEQEFCAFDYWLRHRARKSDFDLVRLETEKNGGAGGSFRLKGPDPSSSSSGARAMQNGLEGLEPVWPPTSMFQGSDDVDPALKQAFYGTDGCDALTPEKGKNVETHEREIEFQGVFTPEYLPLLNGDSGTRSGGRRRKLRKGRQQSPKEDDESSTVKESEDSSSTLLEDVSHSDSEALTRTSSMEGSKPTPLTTQALSSSYPDSHKHTPTHRRSSSAGARSDTSITSLRSSFKDPSTPRSPKKVMFDIDDMVVSPSTSPLVGRHKRSGSDESDAAAAESGEAGSSATRGRRQKKKKKSKAGRERAGEEKFEVIKRKSPRTDDDSNQNYHRHEDVNGEAPATTSSSTGLWQPSPKVEIEKQKAAAQSLLRNGLVSTTVGISTDIITTTTNNGIGKNPTIGNPFSSSSSKITSGIATLGGGGPGSSTIPTGAFVDDFEKVSLQDDMFEFDEDMDLLTESNAANKHKQQQKEKKKKNKKNEGQQQQNKEKSTTGDVNGGEIDEDESEDASPVTRRGRGSGKGREEEEEEEEVPLASTSPHAGSLPIEIKWPASSSRRSLSGSGSGEVV